MKLYLVLLSLFVCYAAGTGFHAWALFAQSELLNQIASMILFLPFAACCIYIGLAGTIRWILLIRFAAISILSFAVWQMVLGDSINDLTAIRINGLHWIIYGSLTIIGTILLGLLPFARFVRQGSTPMEQSKLSLQKCFIIFTLVGLIFGCFAAEERNFIEKIRAMPKRYVTSLPERTTTERFAIIHREIGLRPLYNAVVGSGITLFVFTSLAILIPMRNYRIVLAILLVVITAVIRQFSPFFIFELLRWVAYWKGNDVDLDTTILRTPFIWLKEVRIPVSDGYDVTMVRFASLPERFVEAFLQVGLLFAVILLFRKLNLARIAEPKPIESPANT